MFPLKLIVFIALVSIDAIEPDLESSEVPEYTPGEFKRKPYRIAAGPWGQICAGNPRNAPRRCDSQGCGHYGARRAGGRKHLGVDVICRDGSTVYAPFTGVIGGRANPYRRNNAINNGLLLRGSGFCILMFYIRPIRYSGRINKGQKIGVMLPMQRVYRGITSHVHVQNCNRYTDPTPNL